MYIQAVNGMRIGQTLIVFLLSYMALAFFIESFMVMISQKVLKVRKIEPIIVYAAIITLIMVQIFVNYKNDIGSKIFFIKNPLYKMAFWENINDKDLKGLEDNFNKLILHPGFEQTINDLKKIDITSPALTSGIEIDYTGAVFSKDGKLISKEDDISKVKLNPNNGIKMVNGSPETPTTN